MTQPTAQEEKAKIWAELDAADKGGVAAPAAAEPAPAVVETPSTAAQTADATTAPATSAVVADDPYEGVKQIIKDEILGLKSMYAKQGEQLRNAHGAIGGLKSQLQELSNGAKASATAAGGAAPTAAALKAAQGDSAKMAKLKEDYPEFGAALDAALDEKLESVKTQLAQAKPVDSKPAEPVVTQADFQVYVRKSEVERAHPGWGERVRTPAFAGWLQSQPREVQLLAGSDDPRDAVRLLDLESEARKVATSGANKDTQRLDSAAAIPTGRNASAARVKPVEQMTKAEYWAYLDEQDKQKAAA